jgi:hypothetical protein
MRMLPREPVQSLGSEASYAPNSHPEDIVAEAIIVPELELRNVEVQVFFAEVVKGTDDPAIDNRLEVFDRIREIILRPFRRWIERSLRRRGKWPILRLDRRPPDDRIRP